MADKNLTYTVKLDTASAQAQAAQLRAMFQAELQHIQVSLLDPGALNSALSSTQAIRAQYAQIVQDSHQAAQTLGQANANQLVTQYGQVLQDAQQTAQAMQQAATAQPQRPQQPIGGGVSGGGNDGFFGGGIGGAVAGGLAGYLTVQGAQQIAQQTVAFAEFGTQVRRTEASFKILSGSASEAEARINAIKAAGGGAVSELQAMELANQAVSLHLADTAKGFGDLTKAGREIALVSPVIHDVQGAISELGLAAANLSYRRLDQLGLSATEVKDRMKELQAANSGLDDSQAFLQASIETLDTKYGDLLKTQEAQASGVEKLRIAFQDLWAEISKGPVGKGVDAGIGKTADFVQGVIDAAKSRLGQTAPRDEELRAIDAIIEQFKGKANLGIPGAADTVDFFTRIKQGVIDANKAIDDGVPSAQTYKDTLLGIGESGVDSWGKVKAAALDALQSTERELKNTENYKALDNPAVANAQIDALREARRKRIADDIEPVTKLGNNLKDIGLENFFNQLHDGLIKSAELTANADNHLADMRQTLVDIGTTVKDNNGVITADQRQQVDAINAQIEALTRAAKLNDKLQEASTPKAPGQDLDAIYQRLNAIVAQTRGEFDQTANAARALGDAIAQSGNASADQIAQLGQLAAQANQADFSRLAESLRELNSGSLDAIPGIDSLRDKLTGFYETLASGQGLTAAQAAEFAQLTAEADVLGGSTSALAALQEQLGYSFLNSHEYVAALVQQVANLEALYGAGQIGADQFAGGMNALTGELYSQLQAAGRLTPELARLLTMLNAVKAAASGGSFGPPAPGQGFFGGFGGGGTVNANSAGYQAGQAQAQAAAAAARVKADAAARAEAIKEQTKASKQAASGAQSAFEDAAKGTQKAFENVVDKLKSALEKVPGLFSPSKVTQEDIDASKAGVYQPKADEILRQVKSAAENPADRNRFAGQIQQIKDALNRIGVKPADDLKALAAQAEQAWSNQSLFSAKENLSLINKDAVKIQLDLAKKAEAGRQNIYEYFGATIDAVKEQFGKGDPGTVQAVAAELQGSQDKNLKALGKSLEDGINGAVEKTLKNLAAAEAGFSKGAGGGGGGGGSVSVGAIPTSSGGGTWIDTVSKNVDNAYQNIAAQWGVGPGATVPKANNSTLFGPPAPGKAGGIDTTGLAPTELTGKVKISEITLEDALVNGFNQKLEDALKTATPTPADIGKGVSEAVAIGFRDAKPSVDMAGTFIDMLGKQFGGRDATKGQSTLTGLGEGISGAIEKAFKDKKDHEDMAGGFIQALGAQFGGRKADKGQITLEGLGESLSGKIETGFKKAKLGSDMADAFNQALSGQFGGFTANYNAMGDTISYFIESGFKDRQVRLDMATPFITALSQQFAQQDYSKITDQIQNAINGATLPKEKEGNDGKIRRSSAFDFGQTVDQVNQSLSRSFGASSDFIHGIGDSIGTFIGFGLSDHDFSATSTTVLTSINTAFTGDAARTQLQGIGSAISGAIFQGFASSIAYQPWLNTLVQEVVSQAMESMTNSVNDSLQTQAVGL